MAKKTFKFSITLDDSEFIQVDDHIFTTHDILKREEHNIEVICPNCLGILKEFQGRLSMKAVQEWLLLSQALDQSCSYESSWDDHKILAEIIAGKVHSISWYVENCRISKHSDILT